MAAPWGVVFNKDVFSGVENDFFPVKSDNLENILVLFGDWFTFDIFLKFSGLEVLKETNHRFGVKITTHMIFRDITTSWVNNPNLWEITSNTNIVSKPLV